MTLEIIRFNIFNLLLSHDIAKRSKLSKLQLWLDNQTIQVPEKTNNAAGFFGSLDATKMTQKQEENNDNMIYGLLEDSLEQLKCGLNFKCCTQ